MPNVQIVQAKCSILGEICGCRQKQKTSNGVASNIWWTMNTTSIRVVVKALEYKGREKRYQKEQETALKLEEKAKKKRTLEKERKTKALLKAIKEENKNEH
jgi:dipeptidase